MARQLELPDAEVDRIRVAALLHDVGKVAVPQEILDKPAPLTSAEWRTVVQHPRIGQVILEHAAALRDAVPIILHHHERYAGHGYPYGLRANEIPLGARIVAIADAYDAMTHDRPYKRAMSHDAAIAELKQHAGTQFDPELVALFCDLYTNEAPHADRTVMAITLPPSSRARRERRDRVATSESSETMAAEASGLVDLNRTDPPGPTPAGPAPGGRRGGGKPGSTPGHHGIAAS
jgi:HD-GYP domain-containing protein (c-di-GMP phosphodiesterase class II)